MQDRQVLQRAKTTIVYYTLVHITLVFFLNLRGQTKNILEKLQLKGLTMIVKSKYRILGLLSLLVAFTISSCATIFYGKSGVVKFNSNPQGAIVYVQGQNTGKTTPCEVDMIKEAYFSLRRMRKDGGILYEIQKDNYAKDKGTIKLKLHPLLWVDLLPLYIPAAVDIATQRAFRFKGTYYSELTPLIVKSDTIYKEKLIYLEQEGKKSTYIYKKSSDIDNGLTKTANSNPYRFALIIGNEDYSTYQTDLTSEVNVDYARNDASAFRDYAVNIMGVPAQNTIFLLDATAAQISQGISKLNLIAKNSNGKAEFIIYYAGHGLPDEVTKEPYLIPVDVSGKNLQEGIKLSYLYNKLSEFPSKKTTIFIDACFSGGARNQGLMAARGVRVKPKEESLKGNIIVFTASSDEQSSLPYKEKEHGFFTYYLLKKLKETNGNISYNDLSEYLKESISLQSIIVNDKEQNPQVNVSSDIFNTWGSFKIAEP